MKTSINKDIFLKKMREREQNKLIQKKRKRKEKKLMLWRMK